MRRTCQSLTTTSGLESTNKEFGVEIRATVNTAQIPLIVFDRHPFLEGTNRQLGLALWGISNVPYSAGYVGRC